MCLNKLQSFEIHKRGHTEDDRADISLFCPVLASGAGRASCNSETLAVLRKDNTLEPHIRISIQINEAKHTGEVF
jgi:hypothetical protein